MKTRYEVEVTADDIRDGIRGDRCNCMAQVALGRTFPELTRIEVTVEKVSLSLVYEGIRYRLVYPAPAVIRTYVREFDAGVAITPFRLVLDNPQITEMPVSNPRAARAVSFTAAGKGTGRRRSLRTYGERSFGAGQTA